MTLLRAFTGATIAEVRQVGEEENSPQDPEHDAGPCSAGAHCPPEVH